MKHTFKIEKGLYLIGAFIALLGIIFAIIRSDYVLKIPLFMEATYPPMASQTISATDGTVDTFYLLDSKGDVRLGEVLTNRLEKVGKQVTTAHIENVTTLPSAHAVIIATEHLDRLKDRDILLDYVNEGGTVFFATRPSPSTRLMEVYRQIGLIEIGTFVETTGVRLTSPYFNESTSQSFDTEALLNSSLAVRLDPSARLMATSSEDIPLLWSQVYGEGRFIVFNGTMMHEVTKQAPLFIGLDQGAPLLRPVINAKVTTVKEFPFLSSNERRLSKSMTDRDYYRNVFWADMQRLEAKYDLNYVLATTSPSLNPTRSTSAYSEDLALYGRETLRSGGEIAALGASDAQFVATKQQFDYALPGLNVQSVYLTADVAVPDALPDASVEVGLSQMPFEEEGTLALSTTSLDFEDKAWTEWGLFNELVSSGFISMELHPKALTSETEGEAYIKAFKQLLIAQQEEVPWIRTMTASDARANHHFYNGKIYSKQSGNSYTYTLDEMAGETYFYFHAASRVTDVENCEVERIGPDLYLVRTDALSFTIRLEGDA